MEVGKDKEIKVLPDPDKMTNGHWLLDSSFKINSERTKEMKGRHRSKTLTFKEYGHLRKTNGCCELVCVYLLGCTW